MSAKRFSSAPPSEPGKYVIRMPNGATSTAIIVRHADGSLHVRRGAHVFSVAYATEVEGYRWHGPLHFTAKESQT